MKPAPANDDQRPVAEESSHGERILESRWSGRMTVSVLAGFSILLWALIAGGVYLIVRALL